MFLRQPGFEMSQGVLCLLAEGHQFIHDLKWLLLLETIEQPDEGNLVARAEPLVRTTAFTDLHQVFVAGGGGALELLPGPGTDACGLRRV